MPTCPWNNWFHCTGTTYGQWLRGDPRGWRDRKDKIHVPYDYKSPPPPGAYAPLHRYAQSLMRRRPVTLTPDECRRVCLAFANALAYHNIQIVDLCISPTHFHLLARFVPLNPGIVVPGVSAQIQSARKYVGIAKKTAARDLSDNTSRPAGGIWAVRCKCKPIRDRAHQLRTARYIRAHIQRGAAVWSLLQNAPSSPPVPPKK